jgi:uncharacterized delta-60 repeat protein
MSSDVPVNSWNDYGSRIQMGFKLKQRFINTEDPLPNLCYLQVENALTGYQLPKVPPIMAPVPGVKGILDTSFATNGFNLITPGTSDAIEDLAVQSNDQIVVGGYATVGGKSTFAVARYNSNGSLDTTFATNGFNVTTPGTSTFDRISSIALQSDGKIIAGGVSKIAGSNTFTMARYNINGSLDTTFGTNGYNFTTPSGASASVIIDLAIQSDGKIVAGGTATVGGNHGFALARYNIDGSIDTTFGTNGFNLITPTTYDEIYTITIQPDGKTVAGGYAYVGGTYVWALARYNTNGSIDTTFGTNGFSLITPGIDDYIYALAVQSDGKIVAGGFVTIGSNYPVVIARYNTNGSLDTSFGTNGSNIITSFSGNNSIEELMIQSDGGIIAGGSVNNAFALARYNANGSLDTTFATNGFNLTTPGTSDSIYGFGVQSSGRIVAGGPATVGGKNVFALARYV